MSDDAETHGRRQDGYEYVTARVADQLFGIPIGRVHDVFVIAGLTRVPLAAPEIAGLANIRGRVITAIDLRLRMGLPAAAPAGQPGPAGEGALMAIGIEVGADSYGLIVDTVGEVVRLPPDSRDDNPIHLAPRWAELALGVHRLDGELMVALDVDAVLAAPPATLAAA